MAPLPTIANVFRVAFEWGIGGGGHAINVMHFRNPAGTPAGLAAVLEGNVTASMWAAVTNDSLIQEMHIIPLDGTSGGLSFATTGGAKWSGGTAGDHVPAYAQVVSFSTGLRGRRNRGRIYLPAISEANLSEGVSTAATTGIAAAWNTFITDMAVDQYPLVVASYKFATAANVTTATVDDVFGIQRRRQSRLRT